MNTRKVELCYPRARNECAPSWSGTEVYVNAEHRTIWELTQPIDGYQLPGDSYKLYEMAYHAGDVILEIGTYRGKSAVIALRGALANPERQRPQWYGVDVSKTSIRCTQQTLVDWKLAQYCMLFRGDVEAFFEKHAIAPTMVFLDGGHAYETVKRDIQVLSSVLAQDVPVLCHDYLHPKNKDGSYGVERACDEWEQSGQVKFMGFFGCSALFVTMVAGTGPGKRSLWQRVTGARRPGRANQSFKAQTAR